MKDENAQHLLAKVMGWQDQEVVLENVPVLRLLATKRRPPGSAGEAVEV